MLRLFVAIPLPESLRDRLSRLQGGVPGARWTPPENFHITVRFIGDVDEGTAEDIDAALEQVRSPAFTATLDGVGQFGGAKARLLWAGALACEPLLLLKGRVDSALSRAGVAQEGRKYTPHVTLGRLSEASSGRVGRYLETHNPFRSEPFLATCFILYESLQGRSGSHYIPLQEYALEPSDQAGPAQRKFL